jgi:hypothetical protein
LATPQSEPVPKRYSTRTSSQGLFHLIPGLEKYYRKRINKVQNSNSQDPTIAEDIRWLFKINPSNPVLGTMAPQDLTPWLDDLFKPSNFANICGYSHDVPEKAIDKLPFFQGNNAVSGRDHWRQFMSVIQKQGVRNMDVVMKLFVLSLEDDAMDWFTSLSDNDINTKDGQ